MAAVLACGPTTLYSAMQVPRQLWGLRKVESHATRWCPVAASFGDRRLISRDVQTASTRDSHSSAAPGSEPGSNAPRPNSRHHAGPDADRSRRPDRCGSLEAAVNKADRLGLVDPEALRSAIDDQRPVCGACPSSRRILDRRTFTLTDSELERCFMRLVVGAGLSQAVDSAERQWIPSRLLLARAAPRRRDRRPSVPPNRNPAIKRQDPGSAHMWPPAWSRCASRTSRSRSKRARVIDTLRRVAERQRLALLGVRCRASMLE